MRAKLKNLYASIAPAVSFEFSYGEKRANYIFYAISALIVCTCFLFGQWPYGPEAIRGSYGNRFFSILFIYMILVSTPVTTIYACLSISREKEKKTLTMLRMSGLTPANIIISKTVVCMAYIAFILLPAAPLIAACPFLGGITFLLIFKGLAILSAAVLLYVSAGIFISVLFKKNYICISFAIAFLLFIHFGFAIIDYLLLDMQALSRRPNYMFFSIFSPVEMWRNFLHSIDAQIIYNYNPHLYKHAIRLTYADSALIYTVLAAAIMFTNIKIFEKYLKWRED